jgi:hypothetical protein
MTEETTKVVSSAKIIDFKGASLAWRVAELAERMIDQRDVRALTELLPPQLIAELLLTYAGDVPEVYDEIDRALHARLEEV